MRVVGWRSFLYAMAVLLPSAVLVAVSACLNRQVTIDQSFYAAIAQILPILLFAQLIRLNSVHSSLFSAGERLRSHGETTTARIEAIRARAVEEGADETLLDEIGALEDDARPLQAETRRSVRRAETVVQLIYGCAIATWVLAIAGGATVLAELATNDESLLALIVTVLAVAWLAISLPMFELLLLSTPFVSTAGDHTES